MTAPERENLFNRTSGRVHGYSSRVRSYVRLSISLRASLAYSALILRWIVPLALGLTVLFGFLVSPNYVALRDRALEAMPSPETEGVELILSAAPENGLQTGFVFPNGWGPYWQTNPLRISVQFQEPYADGTAQLIFSLDEDWRVLSGLLWGLLGMAILLFLSFLANGRRLNRPLLEPIGDITETAQAMSEKNLSARINVEGTQNELRDLAVVINDMLDRIEAAYNRQKQFVSDASHELRTPIAVVQGYAGLLQRWGKDSPEVLEEAIAAISSETQSMKELVENLLFLARHDKKTLSLAFEPFDAGEMLRETIKETEIIAARHTIVSGEIADVVITADRPSVKQAVRAFVENAVKYTPEGGTITISSRAEGESLRITVADTGRGIKKEDLIKIFDRFYRTDEARGGKAGGHGLGLSIARIIAASHGGRIHVRSKPGRGSAFTLELPLLTNAPKPAPNT